MFFSLVLVLVLIYTSVSMFIFIALQFVIVAIYHTVYCMPLLVHKFYKINITLWSSHVMQKMIFHPVIILFIENAIENSILQYFSNKVAIFRPKMGVEKRLFQYFWVFFFKSNATKVYTESRLHWNLTAIVRLNSKIKSSLRNSCCCPTKYNPLGCILQFYLPLV